LKNNDIFFKTFIQPENILLMRDDTLLTPKLADFGLSRQAGEGDDMMTKCGTPLYIGTRAFSSLSNTNQHLKFYFHQNLAIQS